MPLQNFAKSTNFVGCIYIVRDIVLYLYSFECWNKKQISLQIFVELRFLYARWS